MQGRGVHTALIRAICILLAVLGTNYAQIVDFSFTSFAANRQDMLLDGDCSLDANVGFLRLTPLPGGNVSGEANLSLNCRAVYGTKVQLYDSQTGVAASFNTSFTFRMSRWMQDWSMGEGLAFIIAPTATVPPNSGGGNLGLFDTSEYRPSDERIQVVAVEFDTFFNSDRDMNDNHVGLDLNDYYSVNAVNLADYGIRLGDSSGSPPSYTVWIDYDAGEQQLLQVYMAVGEASDSPLPQPKSAASLVLSERSFILSRYVQEFSYIGFTATTCGSCPGSTKMDVQESNIYSWNFSANLVSVGGENGTRSSMVAGIAIVAASVSVSALLLAALVRMCCYVRRLSRRNLKISLKLHQEARRLMEQGGSRSDLDPSSK